jgi:hypothetical protein
MRDYYHSAMRAYVEALRLKLGLNGENRCPKLEQSILKHPKACYLYAKDVLHGRWASGEWVILTNKYYVVEYAVHVIGGRWPEAEHYLYGNHIVSYCDKVLKRREPGMEPAILNHDSPNTILNYAHLIIKGRWPEGEAKILQIIKNEYLNVPYNPFRHSMVVMDYAEKVIKGRWHEFEKEIAPLVPTRSSLHSLMRRYIVKIAKGRLEEAEGIFLRRKSSKIAKLYLTWVAQAAMVELGVANDSVDLSYDELMSEVD